MYITETTAAAGTIIPVQDARRQCHIDTTDLDVELQSFLWAAHDMMQRDMRRSILPRTLTAYLDGFSSEIELIWGPITAIDSVKYYDADGVEQTLSASDYWFGNTDEVRGKLCPVTDWPEVQDGRPNAVAIQYQAGGAVPEALKHAARMLVSHWNENRESTITGTIITSVPMGYRALIRNHGDAIV